MRVLLAFAALTVLAESACASRVLTPTTDQNLPTLRQPKLSPKKVYQPLAVGNFWKYICNQKFTIVDRVVGSHRLDDRTVYSLSLQIPSSPTKSTIEIQLLANDAHGNTWIYGYVVKGKIKHVTPTEIVAASPVLDRHYDYPAPTHGKISRIFKGFEYTNRTPLGIFWVAPYFESGGTHNYGYNLGRGVMEEDHGPNYKYDCLIEKYVVRK
ncbi:MAG: hypothetical protein JO104_09865 [Candidatus Eremiobacteraeota bacterium]|nr:hypothetical protein [Candidatus Eremiobacteraeota bacterium]